MNRYFSLLALLTLSSLCSAQLINDGGTITIQAGATLYVESDVTNNVVGMTTGTINVEGTLEVQGNLTNNGTLSTISGSLVKFSGDQTSDFKSNGAIIENMEMAKDDAANGTVSLTDDLTINTNLNFESSANGNKLILGTHDLLLAQPSTTITNASTEDYIVADDAGVVVKSVDADAIFTFPIGDLGSYTPIEVDYTATSYSNASISSNLDNIVHPNKPAEATDYIARYWNVDQTGITDYTATLTGTFDPSTDITGTAGLISGAYQDDGAAGMEVSDWSFTGSSNGTNEVSADVNSDSDLTGMNFFGKANLKVFLGGAYSGGSMNTTLPGIAGFPMSTPYDVAPWNAPTESIAGAPPANTTDWILVEARDPASPGSVLAQKSAFLLSDGSIVGLDGGDLFIKDADPSSIISIRHRNHLGVRTSAGYDLTNAPFFDFSTGTGVYTNGGISNANMQDVGGNLVLWGGDVNNDGFVRYTDAFVPPATFINSDALAIFSALGNVAAGQINGYNKADTNIDGVVRYTDAFIPPATFINSDALYIFSLLGNLASAQLTNHL